MTKKKKARSSRSKRSGPLESARVARVLSARVLSRDEYERLRDNPSNNEQRASVELTRLVDLVGARSLVDADLVHRDRHGEVSRAIERFVGVGLVIDGEEQLLLELHHEGSNDEEK